MIWLSIVVVALVAIGPKDMPVAIKAISDTIKKLDGPAITTLSKTKLEEWGSHKGQGYHLKGKIVGSFPGGVKIFVFSSKSYNVLVTEEYFADELRDVQGDFNYISEHFDLKN